MNIALSAVSADELEDFHQIRLFRDLGRAETLAILDVFQEAHYPRDQVIFYQRDLPSASGARIYFVMSGCVKLVKYSSDGEGAIVRMVAQGEFFGVTGALTSKPYPFSAEALFESRIISISSEDFIALTRQYPQLALNMITELGEMLWFTYETHNQVVKKSDARVAKIILHHLNREGAEPTPQGMLLKTQLPHEYLASMTGITYEESVRIISRLKKTNACIAYHRGGKITITDLDALIAIAQTEESRIS
ncbi:MAG: Crp/Fnr family transcriptional regulator [Vampirovibrionales bacterium]|nr:Crp/Fnr family transcriptional regulator [Vampirovibrionales bacterium]